MRLLIQILTVLAVGLSGAVTVPASSLAADPPPGVPKGVDLATVAEQPDPQAAMAVAKAAKRRIEVADLRAEASRTFAQPNGRFLHEQSVVPERARRTDGKWHPIDTRLVKEPAGTFRAANTSTAVRVSGGGDAPFASMRNAAGREVALTWPAPLPAPRVEGSVATYPEVIEGVDLKVRVDPSGFRYVFVVKTAQAAANPAVAKLTVGIGLAGLTAKVDGKRIVASDKVGAVFATDPALMWDATPASTDLGDGASVEFAPARTAKVTAVNVALEGEKLSLRPDMAVLRDPATRFPVYLDPPWYTVGKNNWQFVNSSSSGTAYWNGNGWPDAFEGKAMVGRDPGQKVIRSFFQFDISAFRGAQIFTSNLLTTMTYASNWGCDRSDYPFDIYHVDGMHSGLTWDNHHHIWGAHPITTRGESHGNPNGQCSADLEVWTNVTGYTRDWAGVGRLEFGLKARHETADSCQTSNTCWGWRRFGPDGYVNDDPARGARTRLATEYNWGPHAPADVYLGGQYCGGASVVRLGAAADYEVAATLHDPDGDIMAATARVAGTEVPLGQASNGRATWRLSADSVPNGYSWFDMKAADPYGLAAWGGGCHVNVDKVRPSPPKAFPADPAFACGQTIDVVGRTIYFTLTANGSADVVGYRYGLTEAMLSSATVAPGGSITVPVTPPDTGNVLHVVSVDEYGNNSDRVDCSFSALPGTTPIGHWELNETTGTTAADTRYDTNPDDIDRPATLTTGAYFQGSSDQTVGRERHLYLNGSTGSAATAQTVLRTDRSFTVSAWVRAFSSTATITAVAQDGAIGTAQDGNRASPFALQRIDGKWAFTATGGNQDNAALTHAMAPQAVPNSSWTYLVGIYDAGARKISLYVNGDRVAEATATVWAGTGLFTIGRARVNGAAANFWYGNLDDVRAYDRVLQPAEIRGLAKRVEGWWHYWSSSSVGDSSNNGRSAWSATPAASVGGWRGTAGTFDGTTTAYTTQAPVVRTDSSFSISAWVRLTRGEQWATAVAQEGSRGSGFFLQYNPEATCRCWTFAMVGSDTDDPQPLRANSPHQAKLGVWTHLAGIYDAENRKIQLYVDGFIQAGVDVPAAWHASGPLVIGRHKYDGGPTGWWQGDIDEVVAVSGMLTEQEIRAHADVNNRIPNAHPLTGDFTGDGKVDALVIRGYANRKTQIWTMSGDGAGNLQAPAATPAWDGRIPSGMPRGWQHDAASWLSGDYNGDSRTDVALFVRNDQRDSSTNAWLYNTQLWVFYATDSGLAAPTKQWDGGQDGSWPLHRLTINSGDVDGDNDADLVVTRSEGVMEYRSWVLRSHGAAGGFSAPEQWHHNPDGWADTRRITELLGDVDGDGKADLMQFYQYDNNQVKLWLNYSDGTRFTGWRALWDSGANNYHMGRVRSIVADVDGDRRTDIVHMGAGHIRVFPANGRLDFTAPKSWYEGSAWSPGVYSGADLNGDGKADLVGLYWSATDGLTDRFAMLAYQSAGPRSIGWRQLYSAGANLGGDKQKLPLAQWKLEGTAADAVNNNRPGTAGSGASWIWSGYPSGGAIRLNGTADGFVSTGKRDASVGGQEGVRTDQSFTVTAWARLNSDATTATVMSQDANAYHGFSVEFDAGTKKWRFVMRTADDSAATQVSASSLEPARVGAWTHLAAVYDTGYQQVQLFVNGLLVGKQDHRSTWNALGGIQIGRSKHNGGYERPFAGDVDEVRVYDQALYASEIAAISAEPPLANYNGNVTQQRWASSSSTCNASQTPDRAIDGNAVGPTYNKWCSVVPSPWLKVDLDREYTLSHVRIWHAGVYENTAWNTRDFDVQTSMDGVNWTTQHWARGNTETVSTHYFAQPVRARHARLLIFTPTSNGDTAARIYEFAAYGWTTALSNVSLGKSAWASGYCGGFGEVPAKAIDGSVTDNSKWCTLDPDRWLVVDLGRAHSIWWFTLRHAGAGGESPAWNTRDYDIETSPDNTTWTLAAQCRGCNYNVTGHWLGRAATARYVRLRVITPTQNTDYATRVYEFEIYSSG